MTASISVPDAAGEPVVGVTVYRIVHEALTNAYRHGEGAAVVDVRSDGYRIRVSASAAGIDGDAEDPRVGLEATPSISVPDAGVEPVGS